MSNQEPSPRGIKRIQQACTNCRRKKAKCSGERPVCEHCKRLRQNCHWESAGATRSSCSGDQEGEGATAGAGPNVSASGKPDTSLSVSTNGTLIDQSTAAYDDGLSMRVTAIESKLDTLVNTINTLLPALITTRNADPLPSPSNSQRRSTTPNRCTSPANKADDLFDPEISNNLPPPQVLSSLVDTYFARVQNQPYCFFHPRVFRQRLMDGLLPDYLVFAVLASSIRFSDDPYYKNAHFEAMTAYARESWKQLVCNWLAVESDPDIYICQAITLLSIIDFTAGRRSQAWLKIGLSIRIAQDLCLMMEPDVFLSNEDQEERRRVFWSIYILDKLCSCGRARPAAITDAHCRVQLPCDEGTFRSGAYKKTSTLDQILSVGDSTTCHPGPLAMVVLVACMVGRSAQHSIHESSKSWLPPWDSKSDFARIYSALLQLETQFEIGGSVSEIMQKECLQGGGLDMQIAGPLIFANALFHASQCILHHPFLLSLQLKKRGLKAPASFLNRALQTCREHACSMSELLKESSREGFSAYYSFMGYCATLAGGVHAMFLNDANVSIRQKATDCLQSNTAFIGDLTRFWRNGRLMSAILQRLALQALPSTSLVVSSPNSEAFDENAVCYLWAAVDYTTMCSDIPTLELHPMIGTRDANGLADLSHFFQPQLGLPNAQSPYPNMIFEGMSPVTSFFGNSSMNFGG